MAYSKQNFQNGQTLDAANLEIMENGIIAGQGVKNLLINSNFKDPINSSGKTSWSSSGFTIDKWRVDSAATVNLTSSGITVDATSVAGNFQQNIDNLPNGTYTFAALVNNVIRTIAFTNNNGTITTVDNSNASFGGSGSISAGKGSSAYYVQINNAQGHTNTIAWVALYEGNYAVDTLPNYIPKDKHIEMSNCGIPTQPHNLFDNSNFRDPVNSRGIIHTSNAGYHIDRWKKGNASGTVTVGDGYIAMSGTGALWFLTQDISKNKIKSGTVYTIALADTSGSISVCSTVMSTDMAKFTAQHTFTSGAVVTTNVEYTSDKYSVYFTSNTSAETRFAWAALYEGFYTADTLPPYVPKDKNVEMVNCCVPLQPRNLLDNSDFRIKNNIINTKGLLDYSFDSGNVFDRWKLHQTGDGRVSIKDGYIELYRKTNSAYLFQHPRDLQSMVGKTYTVAAKVRYSGYIGWIDSTQRVNSGLLALNDWDIVTFTFTVGSATSDIGEAGIEIATKSNEKFQVQWIALYEGAYGLDTIPMYQSESRHIEMLNCNVPLAPRNLLDNSDFRDPVNHQGASEYSGYFSYTIDRWFIPTSHVSVTVQSGSIKATATSDNTQASISQKIASSTRYAGKTLTLAAYVQSNVTPRIIAYNGGTSIASKEGTSGSYQLLICNFTVPADITDGALSIRIQSKSTQAGDYVEAQWAALYEGAYTADTLPNYVPKDKHVEMLNCGVPTSPKNVLKNSDFTNPLNTNGFSSISSGASTTIDCWNSWISGSGGKIELTSSGIKLSPPSSENIGIYQQIENYQLNKIYTVVVYINDLPYLKSFQMGNWEVGTKLGPVYFYSIPSANVLIRINSTNSEVTIQKVALYEGAYTLDTITMYQSESKHVEMLNCNVPLAPHNLLDNSDFRNPVNQRGKTSYRGNVYTIDRWELSANTLNVGSDGITLVAGDSSSAVLTQYISGLRDGTYTQALNVNGTIYTRIIQLSGSTITTIDGSNAAYTGGYVSCVVSSSGYFSFLIRANAGYSITVRWAALYEGAYTADTLPSYVPKGKHVEMLNCGVSLAPSNLLDNSDFTNPVNQRGATSYPGEASKLTYTIDRWNIWDTHAKTEVTASGLKITGIDVMGYVAQLFEKPNKMIGKTYTLAAGMSDGTIICGTATVPSTTQTEEYYISAIASSDTTPGLRLQVAGNLSKVRFQLSVKPGKTYIIAWAALYEGSYDASTLPAYQPKGYAAELAECQRYYYQSWDGASFSNKGWVTKEAISASSLALIEFPTEMRIVPTITFYTAANETGVVKEWTTSSSVSATQNYTSTKAFGVAGEGNFTTGKTYYFHYSASADL